MSSWYCHRTLHNSFYIIIYILYTAQLLSKRLSLTVDLGIRHPKLTTLTVSIVSYGLLLWDNKMRYILAKVNFINFGLRDVIIW